MHYHSTVQYIPNTDNSLNFSVLICNHNKVSLLLLLAAKKTFTTKVHLYTSGNGQLYKAKQATCGKLFAISMRYNTNQDQLTINMHV